MSRDLSDPAPLRPETPHVFLSACSRDLRTFRTILAANLVRLGFHPVVQEDFTLSHLPLVEKLRDLIGRCDFVIHLAGEAYGAEPREQPGGIRRSYTQWEYHLAKEMDIPVYAFLCADDFPYDTPDPKRYGPETAEALALQRAHRDFLKATPKNDEYASVRSIKEGVDQLVLMQPRLKSMCQHLERYLPAVHSLQQETLDAVREMHAEMRSGFGEVKDLIHLVLEQQAAARGYGRLWFPPQRAERFFGRESEFIELLALWDEHRVLAITGTGGLGKTALAAELLAWFGPDAAADSGGRPFPRRLLMHDYYSQPGHDSALAALLVQAGLDPKGLDRAEMESRLGALFAQPDTFLYLEGCEKAELIRDLLRLTGSARVLLTTRDAVAPYGAHGWPLPPLRIPDAAALITHLSGRGDPCTPPAAMTEIATLLAGHGLACRLAGQLLSHQSRSAASLLADLKKKGLGELSQKQREHDSVTWLLRQTALGLEKKLPGCARVWYVLALGALSPLPVSLLRDCLGGETVDEDWLRQRLEALQHEGIVQLSADFPPESGDEGESAAVLAHALIQTYGLTSLPSNIPLWRAFVRWLAYRTWREGWDTFLDRCFDAGQVPGGHRRYQVLVTPLEGLIARLGEREPADSRPTSRLLNLVASVHGQAGRYLAAEPLFRRALEACERTLGPEYPHTLATLNNLAILLKKQGDLPEAEPLYRRALEARDRTLGPEHPDTLQSLNNLAALLFDQGDLAGAEPLTRRALEAQERTLGPEHPDTLESLNNLANLLYAQGDLAGAELLYRRALEARERTLGPEFPDTLSSLNNLANLLYAQGDLAGAEPLYRRAMEAMESTLGPEHPHTLVSLNNLAILLKRQGDLAGAEPLYRRALEAQERTLGPEHPDTLMTLNNLGTLHEDRGEWAEAAALCRRAVAGARRLLLPEHPHRQGYERNLARAERMLGGGAAEGE